MTIEKAALICNAKLCGQGDFNAELGRVIIDSRAVCPGDFFVAYKGENTDGHRYISSAFDKGAVCCLAQRIPEGEQRPILLVEDVQSALEKISAAYRDTLSLPIVGITGSVGKTSAKEMISAVLSQRMNVHKTDKNLNNQIGVPMTISRITPEHQAAVVEMGISYFGDMEVLAKIARPDIAVFTLIGHAHLEFLQDLEGVFREKTDMLRFMADDATVILNGDDRLLSALECRQRKISFGLGDNCDVRAENISLDAEGIRCSILYGERKLNAFIPAFGKHMVYAALEGAAVGFVMGLEDLEIERGIAAYETVGRRAAVTDTGFVTLVDDCYNSNPDSAKCGVDSLMLMEGRKVCILGDMLELGELEEQMHFEVGEYAAGKGVELVISNGPLARQCCLGAGEKGIHFESKAELIAALPSLLKKGDRVLVKASHSLHFEEISEAIKQIGE